MGWGRVCRRDQKQTGGEAQRKFTKCDIGEEPALITCLSTINMPFPVPVQLTRCLGLPYPGFRHAPGSVWGGSRGPKERPRNPVSPLILAVCCQCHVTELCPTSPMSPELLPNPHKCTVVVICGGTSLSRASSTHTCVCLDVPGGITCVRFAGLGSRSGL